ncbi:TPA: hypothetical protein RRD87_004992 [Klebsiella pneumoniae]|uniref:hypothetical protein n=1 Tax=Klebsiella pneumoniae TaxID=573 RepID=UPI000E09DEAD|nr:hypothetical protein [Klebsiella pneumoniae]EIX9247795.1 hypothetical protein [Klebsiella pneumoniae]MBQ5119600.1 hypothetical protein [Klebsiella pneumoniae]MEC4465307.1 hypothetical protein [Klebsiella pneumoniae]RDG82794.1 hypothetical protein DWA36_20940 [Klebsiella pneumoniae]HBR5840310.1 hypothetical protein [Klebsiella pneumoniae]
MMWKFNINTDLKGLDMNGSVKKNLSSKKMQTKRKIGNLNRNLSKGRITQAEYDLYKSLLDDYIQILTLQYTRIFVEEDLIALSNHRSGTFTTAQHDALANKLDKIDYEVAELKNTLNKNLMIAQNSYPSIRVF